MLSPVFTSSTITCTFLVYYVVSAVHIIRMGSTEIAGLDSDGPTKMQGWTLQGWTLYDRFGRGGQ